MNIRNIIIFLLVASPLAGICQTLNYTIEGKVNSNYEGEFIKLYYIQDKLPKTIDSTKITNGNFKFQGTLNRPLVGKLTLASEDNGDRTDVFIAAGTTKVIAKDSIRHAKVSGTKMTEDYERLAIKLRPHDDQFMGAFMNIKYMPEGAEKKAYVAKVMAGFGEYNIKRRQIIHEFAAENPNSYVSLYFIDKIAPGQLLNYETTFPFYDKLSLALKETPLGQELGKRLAASKGSITGQTFKDFASTTPNGEQLSLKDVLGKSKYTLVDFWASWCGPCRAENPHVVKTFNAFKDKGFTVLSVSLDEDGSKWKDAIQKDEMPWYHVSSLKGWKEPAAVLYSIRAIPQNLLIDAQGKIVATNLRAETLYNKVEALLK